MDKELLKKYMQAMISTKTTHGNVPLEENGMGYSVSLEQSIPRKGLKNTETEKPASSFRAGIAPIKDGGRLVRSVSGLPEEVVKGVEEAIKYIEQYYARSNDSDKQV